MAAEATRFKPGQSGNPARRPKGSRNKSALAIAKALGRVRGKLAAARGCCAAAQRG